MKTRKFYLLDWRLNAFVLKCIGMLQDGTLWHGLVPHGSASDAL